MNSEYWSSVDWAILLQSCLKLYLPKEGVSLAAFTMKYCTKYYWLTWWVWLYWRSCWTIEYVHCCTKYCSTEFHTLLTGSSTRLSQKPTSWLSKVWLMQLNISQLSTPSTNSARIFWAAATPVSLHQLSKDLLSCCYNDSVGMLSLTPPQICTQLSIRATESLPQAQQGFAEPTPNNYVHN